jgi:hypothetical protein
MVGCFEIVSQGETMSTNPTLYCSFCDKSKNEVKKLIAGPAVFICGECVQLCTDILEEEAQAEAEKTPVAVTPLELHIPEGTTKDIVDILMALRRECELVLLEVKKLCAAADITHDEYFALRRTLTPLAEFTSLYDRDALLPRYGIKPRIRHVDDRPVYTRF